MSIMSKLTAAYVAGLLDGEGSLEIQKTTKKECIGGFMYRPRIRIAMTDRDVVKWLHNSFGGWFTEKKIVKKNRKRIFCWTLANTGKVKPFIDKVFPYLKVKKERAKLLKKIFSTYGTGNYDTRKTGQGYGFKLLKPKVREYREQLYNKMRELNQRGYTPLHRKRLSEATPKGDATV